MVQKKARNVHRPSGGLIPGDYIQLHTSITYYTFHCYWVQLSLWTKLSAGSPRLSDMASELLLYAMLVLSSCMLAGGHTLCSFSGIMKLAVHIIDICMHVDKFSHSTVTVSVENVSGSIPAARVTCSRALPPDCVTSVVEFRTKSGTLVATNTSSNTVVTKII